ncbi:MAG: hypothetical protein AAB739_04150 [Patescibacteria group bacterium]
MQKYFWLIILISVALGLIWPAPAIPLKPYLSYLLMLMMFFTCLKIEIRGISHINKNILKYIFVLMMVFIVPTLIVFLFKNAVSKDIFIGLLVTAAVPSGISVIYVSDLLKGEPIKALTITTLAHLVSPVVTPALVWFFARQSIDVNFWDMMIVIIKLIVIPLVVAGIFRVFKWHNFFAEKSTVVNMFLTIALIWGIIAPVQKLIFENLGQIVLPLIISVSILSAGIVLSVISGSTKQERITWIITNIMRNYTLASVIVLEMFGPVALLGSVIYMLVGHVILIPLQFIFSDRTHRVQHVQK